jgi:hypothetical protein
MRCPDVSGGVTPSRLTVNQPSYDFEGSSPSSPTSLRSRGEEGCRAEASLAKAGAARATARQAILLRAAAMSAPRKFFARKHWDTPLSN